MKSKMLMIGTALLMLLSTVSCVTGAMLGNKSADKKTARMINRSVRNDSKELEKKGYSVEIGAPGIEWQLRRSMEKELASDANGNNLYLIGVGSAISGIENAARRHAISDAGIDASTLLESKILGLIENDYNNKLYSRDEYETLSKMKGVFSNLIAKKLPIGNRVCTFVRDNGKHYEYQVRLAYSMDALRGESERVISDILSKENDELRKKFERITGLDKLGADPE
jgi:hypothetical protein